MTSAGQSSGVLSDLSAPAVIRAIEANLWGFCAYLGRAPGVELHDTPEMLWYATGIAYPMFNGVPRTQLSSDDADGRIETLLSYFRARRLPLTWWTGPSTQPADLGKRLESRGFKSPGSSPGMAIDLSTLGEGTDSPAGLAVRRVGDFQTLTDWYRAYSAAFGCPESLMRILCAMLASVGLGEESPLRHYVGYVGDRAVACSSAFLGAGVAGAYNIGVIPAERGRGFGSALTRAPLVKARGSGYRVGILHSSPMGLEVYRRIGFEEYCRITTYFAAP